MALFKRKVQPPIEPVQKSVNTADLYPGSDYIDPMVEGEVLDETNQSPRQPTVTQKIGSSLDKIGNTMDKYAPTFDRLGTGVAQIFGGGQQPQQIRPQLPPMPQPRVQQVQQVQPQPQTRISDEQIVKAFNEVSVSMESLAKSIEDLNTFVLSLNARISGAGI